jgi:hypothetical protein
MLNPWNPIEEQMLGGGCGVSSMDESHSPGKYLPACLITQTPALSVSSPFAALNTKSFLNAGNPFSVSCQVASPASFGVTKVLLSGMGRESDMILMSDDCIGKEWMDGRGTRNRSEFQEQPVRGLMIGSSRYIHRIGV